MRFQLLSKQEIEDTRPKSRIECLEYYRLNNNISLPYAFRFSSGKPGPVLLFCGGIHGTEPAGVEASILLHQQLVNGNKVLTQGEVIFILGNPIAYLQDQRLLEYNLNRTFLHGLDTSSFDQTIEGKRSREISRYLDELQFEEKYEDKFVDFAMDLHSLSVDNLKMCIYKQERGAEKMVPLISDLDTHLVVKDIGGEGNFMSEMARRGAVSLTIECGKNGTVESVEVAYRHMLNALSYYQVIELKVKPKPVQQVTEYTIIAPIIPYDNMSWQVSCKTGSNIKKGQIFASSGELQQVAPRDCCLLMPDRNPKSTDTDAGFLATKRLINTGLTIKKALVEEKKIEQNVII